VVHEVANTAMVNTPKITMMNRWMRAWSTPEALKPEGSTFAGLVLLENISVCFGGSKTQGCQT